MSVYRRIQASYDIAGLVFLMNFSPNNSYEDYYTEVPAKGDYRVILSTDEKSFDGWDRVSKEYIYKAEKQPDGKWKIRIYLPSRTGACIARVKKNEI